MSERCRKCAFIAPRKVCSDCRDRELRHTEQQLATVTRLLENLTPGGSEFAGSPERCAKWVSDFMSSTLQQAATASGECNQLREQLTRMEADKAYGRVYVEQLETTIASLQSALVASGHEADCPVVYGASVDCVVGSGCVDYRAKYEQSQDALGRLLQAVGAVDR